MTSTGYYNLLSFTRRSRTLSSLPAQIILEICRNLEPQDLLSMSRMDRALRKRIMSPEAKLIWLVVLRSVPGLPNYPHDMTIVQFASLVFDNWCMSCGTDGIGIHFFNLRLRLCESCQITELIRGSVLKQKYKNRNDVPPIFKVLPSTSDYQESGENDLFFKPAVDRIKKIYSELSEELRQQFILTQTARASYMMDRGFELLVWKRKMQEMQSFQTTKQDPVLSRYDQIVKRGTQEWGWNPQYFPAFRDSDYYPEWQKLLDNTADFNEEEWQTIRLKLKNIYDLIDHRRSLENFFESTQESYRKHTSTLPKPYLSLSATWQQVYDQMIKILHGAEMQDVSCIQGALMHARRFVAGGTNLILFASLLEWGIISIVCRCRLCIQTDGKSIKGYASFLSHLLVDVHPNLADWIHVPREEVKVVNFSDILQVAKEVFELLGFDQKSTVVFKLQLVCRCGHPSYQGPLTFEQLVTHIFNERAWYNLIVQNLKPEKKSMACYELVDDHGSSSLGNKIRLFDARYHEIRSNIITEPPPKEEQPLEVPCCVHCYRLSGQLIPVSLSEAQYHMKKHRQAIAMDCDIALGRLLLENRPATNRRPLNDFTMIFNRSMLS